MRKAISSLIPDTNPPRTMRTGAQLLHRQPKRRKQYFNTKCMYFLAEWLRDINLMNDSHIPYPEICRGHDHCSRHHSHHQLYDVEPSGKLGPINEQIIRPISCKAAVQAHSRTIPWSMLEKWYYGRKGFPCQSKSVRSRADKMTVHEGCEKLKRNRPEPFTWTSIKLR